MGSLALRRVAVELELWWCVPAATMMANWWHVEDSVGANPAYLSRGARRQSRSCLSLVCVADCWHVARSAGGGAQYGHVP
jgi:hypothetical protein